MGYWISKAELRGAETSDEEASCFECFFDFLLREDDELAERVEPAEEEDSPPLDSASERAASFSRRFLLCFLTLDDEVDAADEVEATDSSAEDAPPSVACLRLRFETEDESCNLAMPCMLPGRCC